MNRRDALRMLGAGAALAAGWGAARSLEGLVSVGRPGRLAAHTRLGMGTVVTANAVDPSPAKAEDAIAAAFAALDRLEPQLSRFIPASPVAVLNDQGRLDGPLPSLLEVLDLTREAHQRTAKAFDPTVLPVLAYVEAECAAGRTPDPAELAARRDLVGLDRLRWDPRRVEFTRSGMALTLDGVAKGYIVDAMAHALRTSGVKHGMVDAGGDIAAFGGKAEGLPWVLAVRDPADPQGVREVIELAEGGCTTSGDYEVFFDPERQYYHIFDPATGQCPHLAHSATVVADTAAQADALSTALLVLGPAGRDLVRPVTRQVVLA